MTIVFTAIAVGVIVYILRTARNLRSIGWAITLGLLLGGATGNLLDRIFRAPGPFQGHVVDWIELPHWPVFNLADSSIVCAGVLVPAISPACSVRAATISGSGENQRSRIRSVTSRPSLLRASWTRLMTSRARPSRRSSGLTVMSIATVSPASVATAQPSRGVWVTTTSSAPTSHRLHRQTPL